MSMAVESSAIVVAVPPFPVRKFSVPEYHRMIDASVLQENDRVELVDGWIIPKMTHSPRHDAIVDLAHERIARNLTAPCAFGFSPR
jgi:hypothetical protein